jgi:hypothetical protein
MMASLLPMAQAPAALTLGVGLLNRLLRMATHLGGGRGGRREDRRGRRGGRG